MILRAPEHSGSVPLRTRRWFAAATCVDGELQPVQHPIHRLNAPTTPASVHLQNEPIPLGTTPLPVSGAAVKIDATLDGGTADQYGSKVHAGSGQATVIGYHPTTDDVYVDRAASGNVTYDPSITGLQQASLPSAGGVIHLTVLVDCSSVELFAQGGQALLTDQIFPDLGSAGIATFATGGTAELQSITVHRMRSAWNR